MHYQVCLCKMNYENKNLYLFNLIFSKNQTLSMPLNTKTYIYPINFSEKNQPLSIPLKTFLFLMIKVEPL